MGQREVSTGSGMHVLTITAIVSDPQKKINGDVSGTDNE